ncbi:hypothetical protein [Herminiimonas fonticola]|uniref:Uncharacterized protein n=1 Tax=Herminiimonas fonticola TaxID=303380 RepID=A0A4R6GGR9_9BURK|nr:hypothetical protein [Herminiimonas fonticola]RBA24383.1 hypothetical protein Hfont_0016 [Herminiimonas fonticola]TDN93500.1 hypothetical protein EV677_0029 [Herminiimonas fonticola]
MKVHLFDSWHLPHFKHSKDDLREAEFDILTLLAFSIGVPLLILGGLSLMEILFGWSLL